MAQVNVLEKNSIKDGDKVIVTKTVEEHLTKQDLLNAKQTLGYQMNNLSQQIENLNFQLITFKDQDKELDDLLKMLDGE